jgi:hypothetical protein
MNWLVIARESAFWSVGLDTDDKARRFLAALRSNEEFIERNPSWPLLNSTRSLWLGRVQGSIVVF